MTMHSLGDHRRKRETAQESEPRVLMPIGTFVAKRSLDANAQARNGRLVYAMNDVPGSSTKPSIVEVQFGDGVWLLIDSDEISTEAD